MEITVDQEYTEERKCTFNGRDYLVRDNGSIKRLPKTGGRIAKNDNVWTFGKKDTAGYLAHAGVRVHLIVALAFLGEKPRNDMVVDHKDTIKVNNRPSNLHYVTRFENLVNNPLTREKLEHVVGLPIEKILDDLSILHNLQLPPTLTWVKTVSQAEAIVIKRKMEKLVSKPLSLSEKTNETNQSYAIQTSDWFPRGEFPCCPQHENSSLSEYAGNLAKGKTIFKHSNRMYIIEEFALSEDGKTLAVKCSDPESTKKNILITITYHSKKWFIHKCNRFFGEEGLEKYYTLALGKEWTGGDVIDDYC